MFDTTLRDGEQSARLFHEPERKKSAWRKALTELGVDVLEAGFAIASPGDFESVKTIAETIGQRDDSARCWPACRAPGRRIVMASAARVEVGEAQAHPCIVIATSDLHMKAQAAAGAGRGDQGDGRDRSKLARQHADDVEWSAEDATRSDIDFLARCCEAAIKAGATTINLPDTVGYAMPEDMERMYTQIRAKVPGIENVILSTHNHNDLGMGVANTLAAIRAGARQIESTINGIGERAGNASLEEIIMAIRTRPDAFPYQNKIQTTHLLRIPSKLLAAITGFDVQPEQGDRRSQRLRPHEAGIHQDGVLKNAATYEIMTPESVGWAKNSRNGHCKHSGRAAFRDKLNTLGYKIGDNQMNDAFRRFKDLADRKKVVFDDDIVALVDDEVMRDHERIKFVSLDVHSGSKREPRAEMELEVDGVVTSGGATGDGPVDATFKAIQTIFPHTANLKLFSIGAITEGTDAQAKTTVRLEENGKMVDGQGADTDTIVASARAYVHALNKLLVKRLRTEPEALSA